MRTMALRFLLLALLVFTVSRTCFAQFGIAITIAPPPLPVYEQPLCPGEGYIWVPGYWAWDDDFDDYYWVPGTWVLAPEVGFLWTPPWWGWAEGVYVFHAGYWGPTVGFYGGVDYGFGYFGHGFVGGRWEGGRFFYNREVVNVNVNVIHNVYNERVEHVVVNHVSYNGGRGGVDARPTRAEEAVASERHMSAVSAQTEHIQAARQNRALRASENHGRPTIAATDRAGQFSSRHVVNAREAGGTYNPPGRAENRSAGRAENRGTTENRAAPENRRGSENRAAPSNSRSPEVHARELPRAERMPTPNTGNSKLDQKYQRQQDNLARRQDQERQRLQTQQEREHTRTQQQRPNAARTQQMEQRHQQQTQQMAQRHAQPQRTLQSRQQAHPAPQQKKK